jgi:hypothetical protein
MFWLGQAMVDIEAGAGVFEGMCPESLSGLHGGFDVGGG